MDKLASSDRSVLIRLAARLPKGSEERRTILASLRLAEEGEEKQEETETEVARGGKPDSYLKPKAGFRVAARGLLAAVDASAFVKKGAGLFKLFGLEISEDSGKIKVAADGYEGYSLDVHAALKFLAEVARGGKPDSYLKPKKARQAARLLEAEGIKTAGRALWPDDCKPGRTYRLGYRSNSWTCSFVRWGIDENGPRMRFKNPDGMEWEAYMYHGFMAVGSSADKLIVYEEVTG